LEVDVKLHVAYDQTGTIVAAAEVGEDGGDRIEPRPGQTVADLDIPGEAGQSPAGEYVHRLRVDTDRQQLVWIG
jgi:hypothetical protein